jgi:hypothetical protein
MFRVLPLHTQRIAMTYQLPAERELDRNISLQEAEKISNLSPDSWKRNHRDKIIKLSARRVGIRLRDALMIKRGEVTP